MKTADEDTIVPEASEELGRSEICVSDTPVVLAPECVIELAAEELDWPGRGDE